MKFTLFSRLWFFLPMPETTAARPRGSTDVAGAWEFIEAVGDRGGSFHASGRVLRNRRGWTQLLPLEIVLGFEMMGTWAVPL